MKKFATSLLLLVGSAAAALLVWRKVESDRQDDLWSQADRLADQGQGEKARTEKVSAHTN